MENCITRNHVHEQNLHYCRVSYLSTKCWPAHQIMPPCAPTTLLFVLPSRTTISYITWGRLLSLLIHLMCCIQLCAPKISSCYKKDQQPAHHEEPLENYIRCVWNFLLNIRYMFPYSNRPITIGIRRIF